MKRKRNADKKGGRSRSVKFREVERMLYKAVLWAVLLMAVIFIAIALLEKMPSPAPQIEAQAPAAEESICGNGLIEPGEDCETCYIDFPCFEGEECYYGTCIQKRFNTLWITLPLIFIALIGVSFFSYKIFERKFSTKKDYMQRISGLVGYVRQSLKSGQKEPAIRINAIKAGWGERDVDMAIKEAKR